MRTLLKLAAVVLILGGLMVLGYHLDARAEADSAAGQACLNARGRGHAILSACEGLEDRLYHDRRLYAKVMGRLGDARFEMGQFELAIREYSKAIGVASSLVSIGAPEDVKWGASLLLNRGRAKAEIGLLASALEDLDESLNLDKPVEAYEARARARLRIGDVGGAASDSEAARRKRPDKGELAGRAGLYQFARGDYRQALAAFREASRLAPADGVWVLWGYLAILRLEGRPGNVRDLPSRAVMDWSWQLARYLAGEFSAAQIRELAQKEDAHTSNYPMCEAEFMIAQRAILERRTEASRLSMERFSEEVCVYSFFELYIARYEAMRLRRANTF
jgi:tetratricopeptide (TPR) repeat protein